MPDTIFQVKIEVSGRNLRKDLENIIRSVEGFRVQRSDDTRRADLLIFELGDDVEKDFQLIQSFIDLDTIDEVFLISGHSDPALLMRAIRIGAKEFFSEPVKEEEVRQALERFKKKRSKTKEPVKLGQIIEVIGSKGGVGTTTVAVNIAVSLAEMQGVKSVALIDMNTLFGEVPLFLDMRPSYHWGKIAKNIARLDATFLMDILSKHSSGVYVLPSPAVLNGYDMPTPEIMSYLLGLMQRMFDFVVIDGGQSMDETSLKVFQMSDTILLISLLSLPCLANTNKLLKSFYALGYPPKERIKVVINRYIKTSEISLKDAEGSIDKEIFWTIPNEYRTTLSAINQGKPLCQLAENAPVSKKVRELAEVLAKKKKKKEKKSWKFLSLG